MPLPGTDGDRLFELTVSWVRQGNCEEKNLPPKLLIHSPQLRLFFFLETFVGCALWGSLITLSLAFTPLKSDPSCQPKSKVTPDTDYHELRLGPRMEAFSIGCHRCIASISDPYLPWPQSPPLSFESKDGIVSKAATTNKGQNLVWKLFYPLLPTDWFGGGGVCSETLNTIPSSPSETCTNQRPASTLFISLSDENLFMETFIAL